MKKLLIIIGLFVGVALTAQVTELTHRTYGTQVRDQLNTNISNLQDSLDATAVIANAGGGGSTDTTNLSSRIDSVSVAVQGKEDELTNSAGLLAALSNETGTGVAVFGTSPAFTTSIVMGSADLDESELEIIDGGILSTAELNYVDGVTSAIQTQLNDKLPKDDTIDIELYVKILTDTSTYYTIQWGGGNVGDTVGFNLDSIFWKTRWGGSHTLNITAIYTLVSGVSPDMDVAVLTNTTPVAAGATAVTTTDITTTGKVTWTATTTIDNPTVEPGETLMVRIDQLTQKPYSFSVVIDGSLTE